MAKAKTELVPIVSPPEPNERDKAAMARSKERVLARRKRPSIGGDAVRDDKLGPVYEARVALDFRSIDADGRRIKMSTGLFASAEIKTGTSRVIDFLLSPLERRLQEAGRWR